MKIKITIVLLIISSSFASAYDLLPLNNSYWTNEEFLKSFTASYGVNSKIEPNIDSNEKELFDQLVPLIKSDINSAIQELEYNITENSSAPLDFILGNLYFEIGNFTDAETAYLKAIKKFPNFRRAHNLLGKLHVRNNNLPEAIPYILKTIELGGAGSSIFGLLGYCYMNSEKYDSALTAYQQALLFDPANIDWRTGKIQCLLILEKWDEVISITNEFLNDYPDNKNMWTIQANAYLGKNQFLDAASNYEVLSRMGNVSPDILFQLGDIYVNENLLDLAYEKYLEAINSGLTIPVSNLLRVIDILVSRLKFNEASNYISKVREMHSSTLSNNEELKILNLEAQIAQSQNDLNKSVEILNRILERDPLNGEALLSLAKYYWEQKNDFERAKFYFEAAIKLDDYRYDALLNYAQMLVANKKFENAINQLDLALKIKKTENVARYLEAVERVASANQN